MPMTVEEVRALLREADAERLEVLERSLAADSRKGVRAALEVARKRVDAELAEIARVARLYEFDRSIAGGGVAVGLDEVGRGAVAGPLAVGAVVLPAEPLIAGLNDSKQVRPEQRAQIAEEVKRVALAWTVVYVDAADIDRDGMSASLRRAFAEAVACIDEAGVGVGTVLLDGNPLHLDERERNVVKGDAKSASIAAASIVAKATRDARMEELSGAYPGYGFDENKGYGSAQHIEAIRALGLSDVHRASFCRSFMQETLF